MMYYSGPGLSKNDSAGVVWIGRAELIGMTGATTETVFGCQIMSVLFDVEFYLYPTVGTVLIHSVKPELTE